MCIRDSVEGIRKMIGADSLAFLTLPELIKTVEGSACGFCHGCFDGQYPFDMDEARQYCPELK